MMAYANMMRRDVIRLENCLEGMDDMPLGSGALASTTYPIDSISGWIITLGMHTWAASGETSYSNTTVSR